MPLFLSVDVGGQKSGKKFLIISHRLDPLISVVDYWIEMTSEGLSHLQDVTISKPLTSLNNDTIGEVR